MSTVTAHFTVSQGASPAALTITDDSTNEGTQTYTNRYLTIVDDNGDALAAYPNPIAFGFIAYPTGVITLTGFTEDMALDILMTLVPVTPAGGSTYTYEQQVAMNRFLQQGEYNIQQARFIDQDLPGQAGIQAQYNSMSIIIEARNSQTAVLYGSLTGAQEALDRGQNIINNQVM